MGDAKVEYGNPLIEVKVDQKGKKIHIIDQGIGMTSRENEGDFIARLFYSKYIRHVNFQLKGFLLIVLPKKW